jgi:hypothetical protein
MRWGKIILNKDKTSPIHYLYITNPEELLCEFYHYFDQQRRCFYSLIYDIYPSLSIAMATTSFNFAIEQAPSTSPTKPANVILKKYFVRKQSNLVEQQKS